VRFVIGQLDVTDAASLEAFRSRKRFYAPRECDVIRCDPGVGGDVDIGLHT
jgi:hypothetical protein